MTSDGKSEASWNIADTHTHKLQARLAITHLPVKKPHLICLQIHHAKHKMFALRLEGNKLLAEGENHQDQIVLKNYALGTPLDLELSASHGKIRLSLDQEEVLNWQDDSKGCYFKIGCYTQSNIKSGDLPSAFGEVIIYSVKLLHEH